MGVPDQRQPPVGLQALGGARRRAQRVLDLLRLVDDHVAPRDLLQHLFVPAEKRVARDHHVGVLELVLALLPLGAVPERVAQRRRELVDLAQPVGDHARRRHDERLEGLALAFDLRVLVLHREKQRQRLHGLAEPHVVGQDAAGPDLVQEPEPLEALLLVRAELRLQVARLARPLDFVDVVELLEELLGVGPTPSSGPPGPAGLRCGRPARAAACPPLPPPVARISACRCSTSRTFCGSSLAKVPSASRTYRRPSVRQRASSSCVTATPSLSKLRRSESQSTPLETRALAESASSRTCTSTRSSGTKMSQSSGS